MTSFKRFLVACLLVLAVCTCFAFADEGIGELSPEPTPTVEPTLEPTVEPTEVPPATPQPSVDPTDAPTAVPPVVVVVQSPEVTEPDPTATPEPTPEPTPAMPVIQEPVVQPPDGFAAIIIDIFGSYSPRMQSVITTLPDGTEVVSIEPVPGLAGLDWPWLTGVALFAIFLNGFMVCVGVLLKHG